MDEVFVPGLTGGIKLVVIVLWVVFTLIVTAYTSGRALYVWWRDES